ncbi:helix-turn-helix domain-containing protein [Nonomuraea bangladeshensis]
MAARTGYTVQHVRRMCRTGRLPARRAGRDWLITVEEEPHDDHPGRHTR